MSCEKKGVDDGSYFKDIPFDRNADIPPDMAVDLGLSVKWRSGNLGARLAHKPGDFYAWGVVKYYYSETNELHTSIIFDSEMSDGYVWKNYPYSKDGVSFKRYTIDGETTLRTEDDAAHVILGGKWRIPTKKEWQELCTDPDIVWESKYVHDYSCWKVTSNKPGCKGHYIIIPSNGYITGVETITPAVIPYYWSSDLGETSDLACAFRMNGNECMIREYSRCEGRGIRPVLGK